MTTVVLAPVPTMQAKTKVNNWIIFQRKKNAKLPRYAVAAPPRRVIGNFSTLAECRSFCSRWFAPPPTEPLQRIKLNSASCLELDAVEQGFPRVFDSQEPVLKYVVRLRNPAANLTHVLCESLDLAEIRERWAFFRLLLTGIDRERWLP